MGNYYMNEQGQVAVLVSGAYGGGWFTRHGIWRLCVDAELCRAIDEGYVGDALDLAKEIAELEGTTLLDNLEVEDMRELQVYWVDRHKKFFVYEYDGMETVWYKHQIDWIQL